MCDHLIWMRSVQVSPLVPTLACTGHCQPCPLWPGLEGNSAKCERQSGEKRRERQRRNQGVVLPSLPRPVPSDHSVMARWHLRGFIAAISGGKGVHTCSNQRTETATVSDWDQNYQSDPDRADSSSVQWSVSPVQWSVLSPEWSRHHRRVWWQGTPVTHPGHCTALLHCCPLNPVSQLTRWLKTNNEQTLRFLAPIQCLVIPRVDYNCPLIKSRKYSQLWSRVCEKMCASKAT